MVLVVSYLAPVVLIIAGFVILGGRSVIMVILLGLGRVPLAPFLDQLLLLFHYPPRSSGALLAGTLPLRYCSAKFASRTPVWALPVPGHVAGLITVEDQVAQVGRAEVAGRVSGLGGKRFRQNRKAPAHLVGHCVHARPRVWKRLHCFGYPGVSDVDCKRRRCCSSQDPCGLILRLRRPTSPGPSVEASSYS